MKITELAVKRPVTTVMFFVAIIIMGTISLLKTPRELLPSLVYPQVTIVTVYENATPEEMERMVTKIVEEAIGTVNNLKRVHSISKEGMSLVVAEFSWGTNMDMASMDVREKVDLVKERLPRDSEEPIVIKFNPFELPVITLSITKAGSGAGTHVLYEMRKVAKDVIKNRLEKIKGVASVEIKGGREREILVEVDQRRLKATEVSLLEVVNILKNSNLSYPAGTIKKRFYEYLIRTMGEYKDVEDIRNTPLKVRYFNKKEEKKYPSNKKRNETPKGVTLLKDISKVSDTYKKQESIFRYNGDESISISVKKQSGTNIVRLAKQIRKKLVEINEKLPSGYNYRIIYDQSKFIEKSIFGVARSAVIGSILAFLVLFAFLRNFRNSLIITIAIPVSLMGTFILMYFQNISINMMSLGGLALGIGMLVDNSVVVLENIFRLNVQRKDKGLKQNAIDGASQVTGAITSSTLTTITVFLPFIFVMGVAGQLFKELAYTVTFSLITSLFVAVTLIPRLASSVYGFYTEPKWSGRVKAVYRNLLNKFQFKKNLYYIIIIVLFAISLVFILNISREFLPRTKQREFLMKIELPPGTHISATDNVTKKIEQIIKDSTNNPVIITSIGSTKGLAGKKSYSIRGPHQAEIMVKLEEKAESTNKVIKKIKNDVERLNLAGEIEYITQQGIFGGKLSEEAPISIDIKGEEMDELVNISNKIEGKLGSLSNVYGIKNSFKGNRPELKIDINKDRASLYGISTKDVTLTAQTAIKGFIATELKEEEEETEIRVSLEDKDRKDYSRIGEIIVHSPLGFDVKLSQLATFKEEMSSSEITRKEGQRTITVTANYLGNKLSKALSEINKYIEELGKKHSDYFIVIGGEKEKMKESFGSLYFVIGLSILFVYMIMASQFESLWQPFIIIFTVPLSVIGVALFLFFTGATLNVVVLLGIIMLGGIVVNNGIVLISYFNIFEKRHYTDLKSMVVRASATRLRPVLMTALTTVLGLVPMAVSGGQGSELRAPLAITVIGGLLISTFLTLFVIPSIYLEGRKFIEKFNPDRIKNIFKNISW
ncbi:MAG: efflux RND transporter permease subunit [Elusimicrobiota bacterium]